MLKNDVSTATVRRVVRQLMCEPALVAQLVVAGGMVPWLISGRDAGRRHGDLDLVAHGSAMPVVRRWLQTAGYYDAHLDSAADGSSPVDYGLYAHIAGVLINVAPFVVHDTAIVQYNCSFAVLGDTDAGVRVTLPALTLAEYVEHRPWHAGTQLAHFPLALVKATKQITLRPKDMTDIAEIDRLGVDAERVAFYDKCFRAMELQVYARTAHA